MGCDHTLYFHSAFSELTGYQSCFPWQSRLYDRFLRAELPPLIDLPTGTGKTSIMAIWLIALAAQAQKGHGVTLPRRLVWVVDRRVVVDQATQEAGLLSRRLLEPELANMRNVLCGLAMPLREDESPLAVSTLRGEFQDNGDWSRDPARPAIVVGTVDMVGSRLLFSGYGDSRKRRPVHAALLGQDALIINDEAHLTPAFAELIDAIQRRQDGASPPRAICLTATQRKGAAEVFPQSLDEDIADPLFQQRYQATKSLELVAAETRDLAGAITKRALSGHGRTLVFVRSPQTAAKIADEISRTAECPVPVLTGTMRGWERDRFLERAEVQPFLGKESLAADAPPCWIVATSAGEVGINLSCDLLVSELDTAERLIQRFGRLNRFGETTGQAVVLLPLEIGDNGPTVEYLRRLEPVGVSPAALRSLPPPPETFSSQPHLAPLHDWHVDVWSLTSIRVSEWPSRPAVEPWLHGVLDKPDPPETWVTWRRDVVDLVRSEVCTSDIEQILEVYPVLAHERLKTYPDELQRALAESVHAETRVIAVMADGEVVVDTLANLVDDRRRLAYATLILPPGVGAVKENGLVDWAGTDESNADVSARCSFPQRLALRNPESEPPGLRLRFTLDVQPANEEGDEQEERICRWCYYSGASLQRSAPTREQTLEAHQRAIVQAADALAARLNLDETFREVLVWAASWHDAGKARAVWQAAAGAGEVLLAKSCRLNSRRLAGFRHELASLRDAEAHVPDHFTIGQRDLALHLIAAHHGWARPHFSERAYDRDQVRLSRERAAVSAMRFGLLQQRYGAWGLAYLETLLRCVDALASAEGEWNADA
jgi:CRISPR-associated endonuclease/helicase Cas3